METAQSLSRDLYTSLFLKLSAYRLIDYTTDKLNFKMQSSSSKRRLSAALGVSSNNGRTDHIIIFIGHEVLCVLIYSVCDGWLWMEYFDRE